MRAFVTTLCFAAIVGTAIPASAQSVTEGLQRNATDQSVTTSSAAAPAVRPTTTLVLPAEQRRRPAVLLPLYASYAALQMSDAALTIKGLGLGAHEANGVMKGVVSHPLALYSMKAAVTASMIFGAERLWHQGRRKSAIGMIIAGNVLMGVVVNHNRQVIQTLSR
jgi:hypothetical protein